MENESMRSLAERVEALEKWKYEKERRQIAYPLDVESIETLKNYFVRMTQKFTYPHDNGITILDVSTFVAEQGEESFELNEMKSIFAIAEPSTDVFTIVSSKMAVGDGYKVAFYGFDGGSVPSPITKGVVYYVVDAAPDGRSFKVSSSPGGTPVNLTTAGENLLVRFAN